MPEIYLLYGDVRRLGAGTASMVVQYAFIVAPSERGTAWTLQRVRDVVSRDLPDARVTDTWHFRDLLWIAAGARPLLTMGAGAFAGVALLLMTAGFYGMVSSGLAARQREIGIRLALGATPVRIARESLMPAIAAYLLAIALGVAFVVVARGVLNEHEAGLLRG